MTAPTAPERAVALDGPSGSGKSSVAKAVAARLGWRYVDTGATYRAATLHVLRAGTDPGDAEAVAATAVPVVRAGGIVLRTDPGASGVELLGEDVTAAVRRADVTAAVSAVSAVPALREALVELQRLAAGTSGSVVEGRDICAVVLPSARVKVYLDASAEARAARRAADDDAGVTAVGGRGLVAAVADDIARRDALDSSRTASPLSVAPDAVVLDSTGLSLDEVVDRVLRLVEERIPDAASAAGTRPGGAA